MGKVFVIMKEATSPVAICQQYPHEVVKTKKKAKKRVDELNAKAIRNKYWFESVPFNETNQ